MTTDAPQLPRTRPARRLIARPLHFACILYAAAVIVTWLGFRYLADRFWPATVLLYGPRWAWLLPLLILLPLSIRRKRLWILPLLTGLFVLGPFMSFHVPWHRMASHEPQGPKIRLLTCNVHRLELNVSTLDGYIISSDPDVVVLQDYSGWDDSPVLRSGWNVYRLGEIFVASRLPIRDAHNLDLEAITGVDDSEFPRHAGSGACFDIQTAAGIVHLLNVHLASPHTALTGLANDTGRAVWKLKANSVRRWNESQKITDFLATLHGPVIVAGDFNTLPESPNYRCFWSRYTDAFPDAGFGYGYTHYSTLSELRLDHVLYGPGIVCTACEIGPACGTPHRPMLADLVLTPPASEPSR